MAPRLNCLVTLQVPQLVESPPKQDLHFCADVPLRNYTLTKLTGPADSPPPSTTNSANSVPSIRVERSITASPQFSSCRRRRGMAAGSTTGLGARVGATDLPPTTPSDEDEAWRHSRARCRLPQLRRWNASSRC